MGAHLFLTALGVMKAQIVGGFGDQRVKRRVAGKAKNVVAIVLFYPFPRLDAAVMTVAAPHDAGIRPMPPQELRHVLDDGPHLRALRGARRAQDGGDRRASRDMIDLHRREAALLLIRLPQPPLLAPLPSAPR